MAIPTKIKQLADDIRTKIYGREVRESLASGIEEAGNIADEANSRSQSTETKQASLAKKYDEQIANMSLENPSAAEVVDARVSGYDGQSYTTIGKRMDKVDAQLEKTIIFSGSPHDLWKAPTQPSAGEIAPGGGGATTSAYYAKYDALMNDYPEYITKTFLSKDASGQFDIYKYVFEPEKYEKTIILSSLIHGSELLGFRGLLRVMHHICYDYDKYPQMAYMRNNVRIVVVPIINPWALNNHDRYNSNGVDINRNFDYNWTGNEHGGPAPFSEPETIALKTVFESYPDAHLYMDFHNTDTKQDSHQMYTAIPIHNNSMGNLYAQIMHALAPVKPDTMIDVIPEATDFNYAAENFGMITASTEWVRGAFDPVESIPDITRMVEFFGNMIVQATLCNNIKYEKVSEPKVILMTGKLTGGVHPPKSTTSTSWEEISEYTYTFYPAVHGLIEIHAIFNHINEDPNSINYFSCSIEQNRNERYSTSGGTGGANHLDLPTQQYNTEVMVDGGRRTEANLMYAGKVIVPTNQFANPVKIKFYWKTTSGTLQMRGQRILIKFTPTDDVRAFEHWREVETGTITEDYPGTKF